MVNRVQQFAQAYSQAPWRKQVQLVGFMLLCLLFIVMAASVYLNLNSRVATIGREILLIQDDIQNLELINADLQTQLGILKSPAFLKEKALEMGFRPTERDEQVFIIVQGYHETDQSVISSPTLVNQKITLSLPPDFTESLVDYFWERFPFLAATISEVKP